MFFAVDEFEKIHSVVYLIWDNKTAYFHLAGDDPALRNSGASILLTWETIRYAREVLKDIRDGRMKVDLPFLFESDDAEDDPKYKTFFSGGLNNRY